MLTLSCGCDMPIDIYCDWLQDQGWDVDELRSEEEAVFDGHTFTNKYGTFYDSVSSLGSGYGVAGRYGDAALDDSGSHYPLNGNGRYISRYQAGCGNYYGYYYPDHH